MFDPVKEVFEYWRLKLPHCLNDKLAVAVAIAKANVKKKDYVNTCCFNCFLNIFFSSETDQEATVKIRQ